jgi:proteasome beta subunit
VSRNDLGMGDVMRAPVHGPGSSFSEVLKAHGDIGAARPAARPEGQVSHPRGPLGAEGTTVLALRFEGGVIVAGDRRATEGFQIAHRSIEKVFAADDMSAVAIAGAAGPAVEIVRLFQTELEHYEKVEGERLTLEGKANKLSQMIRANLPAAMQGLVVVPLFAGFDEARSHGRIFKYDVTGGRYEEDDYHATGSGGKDARSSLKKRFHPELSRAEAIKVAIEALFDAADEDVGTGGPDLMRGIFPTVAVISNEGMVEVPEEEIKDIFEELISERIGEVRGPESHPVDVRRPGEEA